MARRPAVPPRDAVAVPGALRGYRVFAARRGQLWPTVHAPSGPWEAGGARAVCAARRGHAAPHPDCACGLYGWYHPDDARASSGLVTAVISATGTVVMGEHGFRAERAVVEAVAVPHLGSDGRTTEAIARAYPGAKVYRSRRSMLRDHPPDGLSALGIDRRPSPASRYRTLGLIVWGVGLAALYSVVVLPRGALSDPSAGAALAAMAAFLCWQAALIRLSVLAGGDGRDSFAQPAADRAPPQAVPPAGRERRPAAPGLQRPPRAGSAGGLSPGR